jgi:glycosyltransferase involved in cell wall biosynthesis
MKNDLKKLGFPEERIRIHHLGIDLSTFVPISNDGRNDFIFCTACRLDKSKGVQLS